MGMTKTSLASSLVTCLAAGLAASYQEPTAAEVLHDLSSVPQVGRPVLVEWTSRVRGSLTTETPQGRSRAPVDERRTIALVDEFTAIENGGWEGVRRFLRFDQSVERTVRDPELVGVRVAYREREGMFDASTVGRGVRGRVMDGLLAEASSFGFDLGLPVGVGVGESLTVAPHAVGTLLTDAVGDVTALGEFELVSVDELGLARLVGRLVSSEVRREETAVLAVRYEGDCKLIVDTRAHRLVELDWSGERSVFGSGIDFQLEGSATFEVGLNCATGAAVTKALLLGLRYRSVPRTVDDLDLTVELPSHWFLSDDADHTRFTTTLYGGGEQVTLEFGGYAIGAQEAADYIEATIAQVRAQQEVQRVRPVRCSLGRGQACEFESAGRSFWFEVLPLGPGRALRVRLFGEPSAVGAALADWKVARRSLELSEG
ncbi:hypothetical protein [Engelhardtia mirabilis]|uniref:Uncharacterized protein n=1 Tax=Engelhardtia mirabilis TaxID=2528011 RepID=A0A518BM69_9BACT|nr:hypothetical protein Pla133_31270 [Planctomycetes bacterium Pla133]QDV02362.1 hypothetical protein Pla86_31260 [Planctomycetes bacterium Pla86]